MSDTPKRKRHWLQFSLRSLLIFTVLCAVAAAWLGRKIEGKRREQAAVDAIRSQGGAVFYDYRPSNQPDGPAWLRSLLGENFFNEVQTVAFGPSATDDSLRNLKYFTQLELLYIYPADVTDAGTENLRGLTRIQSLSLFAKKVSDAGLANVKELTTLQYLSLEGTGVSDSGLECLKGLTKLESLNLRDTKTSDAGVAELKKSLPNCRIDR